MHEVAATRADLKEYLWYGAQARISAFSAFASLNARACAGIPTTIHAGQSRWTNAGRDTFAVAKGVTVSCGHSAHAGAVKWFEKHFRTLTGAQLFRIPGIFN